MSRQYLCECKLCCAQNHIIFKDEPYPEYDSVFEHHCNSCGATTLHCRALTRKTRAEIKRNQLENELRQSIVDKCAEYGFSWRFVYQSVIISTPLAEWCFDYHQAKKTLYHESTVKINFKTGDYCKAHCQFKGRRMSACCVIDYIASHDEWRASRLKFANNSL